jgi:luciferase family oxidoreductase group 1
MPQFSILDLVRVGQDWGVREALDRARDLAAHAEQWGYTRFWVAEHHNMPGIASSATALTIQHIAAGTKTIRVGSGGIMLPNHAPLIIAEQFGTLAHLFPGRIDLGLGRAPGTDQATLRALRRSPTTADHFPQDVLELQAFLAPAQDGQTISATPGAGTEVPLWILGSSTFGAQLAAHLGLPYGFASHFAPAQMEEAIALSRRQFKPSDRLAEPYVSLGLNLVAADTDAQARRLFTSIEQAFANLHSGHPGRLPPPVDPAVDAEPIRQGPLASAVVGGPETIRQGLEAFIARHRPDEVIVTSQIYEHAARVRSYEILAQVRDAAG